MISLRMIILLFAIQRQCFASLSKFFVREDLFEILTGELGTTLSNCNSSSLNHVGIWGDSTSSIQWLTKSLENVPRIVVTSAKLSGHFSQHTHWRRALGTFVIITSSRNKLKLHIEQLKKTIWWNPWRLFILVDDQTVETRCQNVNSFLRTAWNESILRATFLCINPKNTFKMYTFNPYTREAPTPWRKVSSFLSMENNHPCTLFERNFIPGKTTCDNFTFEKSSNLGGYPVKAIGLYTNPELIIKNRDGQDVLDGRDGAIARTVFNKLNATLVTTIRTNQTSVYALVPPVQSGEYDIMLNALYIYYKENVTMLLPHMNSGLSIMSRYPQKASVFINILRYMNPSFLMGLIVVKIFTIFVLGNVIGRGYEYAIIEAVRLLTHNCILRFPRDNPTRIYMVTVLFLYMITNWCFQSKLSSLLTFPGLKLTINNNADLKAAGYKIYTLNSFKRYIFDEELFARTTGVKQWDCSEYVLKYENVVCVADRPGLMILAEKKKMYISQNRLMKSFLALVVRPNWPLHHRTSAVLNTLSQNGMTGHVWERKESRRQTKIFNSEKKKYAGFSEIKLQNLIFVFHILIVGLAVSIVTFVFEIWIERRRQGVRMRRMRIILPFVP